MIVGAAVILFDPIFQGLAIPPMAGEVASLLLSRMAGPVLYYMAKRHERAEPVPLQRRWSPWPDPLNVPMPGRSQRAAPTPPGCVRSPSEG